MIESCDNILLYYSIKFVNISNFIVCTCKNSVIVYNPYVIYCKTSHLHSRLQLFFNYFFCPGGTVPLARHKTFRHIKVQSVQWCVLHYLWSCSQQGGSKPGSKKWWLWSQVREEGRPCIQCSRIRCLPSTIHGPVERTCFKSSSELNVKRQMLGSREAKVSQVIFSCFLNNGRDSVEIDFFDRN